MTYVKQVAGIALIGSVLCIAVAASASPDVWVYRPDGTLQCGQGQEESLEKSKQALEKLGAKVEASEKRDLPVFIITLCGAPTGKVNAHRISAKDWEKVKSGFVGPNGFEVWPYDSKTAEVFKYDGTLQCGMGKEVPLAEMAKELTGAGIKVLSQRKGHDGLMHIALCGASTGATNVFEIDRSDLKKARDRGFADYNGPRDGHPSARSFKAAGGDDLFPWPW